MVATLAELLKQSSGYLMTRIDVPTLQCDRCKNTTQDADVMAHYQKLTGMWNGYGSTKQEWDLCPECWVNFNNFMAGYS